MSRVRGPVPTQIEFWRPGDLSGEATERGQWLTCLRETHRLDRLVVWEGVNGRGLVAVVDFAEQRRSPAARVFEGWGRVHILDPVVDYETVVSEPVLANKLSGRTHGMRGSPKRLTPAQGRAIARLTRLPPHAIPTDEPNYDEEVVFWADDDRGPPEAQLEDWIHTKRRLWERLGFPSRPHKQRRLPSGLRPDLRSPGLVADVKRLITRGDGPAQLEGYIAELDLVEPNHAPWKGLLIHAHDWLDEATTERLDASPYANRIQAWAVVEYEKNGRVYEEVVPLYP
jgi:hypothetical protein